MLSQNFFSTHNLGACTNVSCYIYVLLPQECSSGAYGKDCTKKCSGYCLHNKTCNHIDGNCTDGCQDGYIGNNCNTCKTSVNVNFYQFSPLTLYLLTETSIYIIFQPANTGVTAKTVYTTVPQIVRLAIILTVHAVVMQGGADPTVVLVFMLLFLIREQQLTHRYALDKQGFNQFVEILK